MCNTAAILKLSLIMFSLGPTFLIRAPTEELDNSVFGLILLLDSNRGQCDGFMGRVALLYMLLRNIM